MKRLYFIRHGESEGNVNRVFSGRADHPLTEYGRQQAALAADEAANLIIDLIVTSPLRRAAETAEIIADRIGYPKEKIMQSALLMERSYGELQGKPYEAIPHEREGLEKITGVESEAHLLERGKQAADMLRRLPNENILVVGHGTFGRVLHKELFKDAEPVEVPIEQELPNAKILQWL